MCVLLLFRTSVDQDVLSRMMIFCPKKEKQKQKMK